MLSRKVIDKKLEKLRNSRIKDGSYYSVKPVNAMCYSMILPTEITIQRKCHYCNKEFDIETTNINNDYYDYEEIVEEFLKLGIKAELHFLCPECIEEKGYPLEFILILDSNEDNKIVSYPYIKGSIYRIDEIKTCTLLEYELALMFLSGNHTYESFLKDKNFSFEYRDRQIDKFMIDRALYVVLGLDIKYDKKEAIRQFECYVNKYNRLKKEIKKFKNEFNNKLNQIDGDIVTIEQFGEILLSIFDF